MIEEIIKLIQFARDTVPTIDWIGVSGIGVKKYLIFSRSNWAHANGKDQVAARQELIDNADGDCIAILNPDAYADNEHIKIMIENSGQGEEE